MLESEYLVAYGLAGDFGRFRPVGSLTCERGRRVVVRTHRGVEAGRVLRPAAAGHARFLPNTTVGQLVRCFGPDDAKTEAALRRTSTLISRRVDNNTLIFYASFMLIKHPKL